LKLGTQIHKYQAFEKNGLKLVMTLCKPDPSDPTKSDITCTFTNASGSDMSALVFQAAVPKFVLLTMKPPSGSLLTRGGSLTQVMSVCNTQLGQVCLFFYFSLKATPPDLSLSSLTLTCYTTSFFMYLLTNCVPLCRKRSCLR